MIICVAAKLSNVPCLKGLKRLKVCGVSDIEVYPIGAWERNVCPPLVFMNIYNYICMCMYV